MHYQSFSSKRTEHIGFLLGKRILREEILDKYACVVALSGELGSGKTTFTQGLFRGFGVRRRSASPTFVLMRRFPMRTRRVREVFHIDAYRLARPKELDNLGIQEILRTPKTILVIEWADKIKMLLPKKTTIWVRFQHGTTSRMRSISLPFILL